MRRFVSIVVCLLLALTAFGCGCSACTVDDANDHCVNHGGIREWNSGWGTVVCMDGTAF